MKPQLLIFDVNETLLDLSPLKESVNKLLGSSNAFNDWFSKLIQFAMVKTLTEKYSDFGEIGAATLKMTSQKYSTFISEKEIVSTLKIIKQLKPHPEVKSVLETLKSEGFRLVTLTNGGSETLKTQMASAGLQNHFDALYSVESVQKFKPHPETYNYVLEKENIKPENAMLIAAHAWDIAGAQGIGMQTAFIKRSGKFLYPKVDKPDLICEDFDGLCKNLLSKV